MTKEEFLAIAAQEYDQWNQSKSSDPSVGFYEYEMGFIRFMNRMGQGLFQSSLGKVPANRRKKNDCNQLRQAGN